MKITPSRKPPSLHSGGCDESWHAKACSLAGAAWAGNLLPGGAPDRAGAQAAATVAADPVVRRSEGPAVRPRVPAEAGVSTVCPAERQTLGWSPPPGLVCVPASERLTTLMIVSLYPIFLSKYALNLTRWKVTMAAMAELMSTVTAAVKHAGG